MKLFIALLLVRIFCPHYYTTEALAVPTYDGSVFTVDYQGEMHLFGDSDRYHGKVTLVMDGSGTDDDCTDDKIMAVFEH